jgi:hypothetical protein
MTNSHSIRRATLERQLTALLDEHRALEDAHRDAIDPVTRERLKRGLDAKLAEIEHLEQQLAQRRPPAQQAPSQPDSTDNGNPTADDVASPDPRALRNALTGHFDLNELRLLSADLGVDFDNLGGSTKQIKALELVQYLQRRGRLAELAAKIRQERPGAGV